MNPNEPIQIKGEPMQPATITPRQSIIATEKPKLVPDTEVKKLLLASSWLRIVMWLGLIPLLATTSDIEPIAGYIRPAIEPFFMYIYVSYFVLFIMLLVIFLRLRFKKKQLNEIQSAKDQS